jgi:hypothetical protein
MKLAGHFDSFIRDTVNLNQTRIDRLNNHVVAVQSFLKKSDYEPRIRRFSAQGSWAHKTIIKPLENKEFDADLVMFIKSVEGWSASDYVDELYQVFKNSGTYKEKSLKNNRCVTLNYSGDFHLDVVPCVVTNKDENECKYEICNSRDNKFEETKPEKYTAWLVERNSWIGYNNLRKVTRLAKYLRDIKGHFSVKSILLTTLLGNQIQIGDQADKEGLFDDLPTALISILGRLDDYLQDHPNMPDVCNPVLPQELFTRHWDQKKYVNFRTSIHRYREWMDDAYEEPERDKSIQKWRKVFGDAFAKGVVLVEEVQKMLATLNLDEQQISTIDNIDIKLFDFWLRERIPATLSHVKRQNYEQKVGIIIKAYLYEQIRGAWICEIKSGTVLGKQKAIKFQALQKDGLPFAVHDYRIEWRVVNTGNEARQKKCLRGDFYSSEGHAVRWEKTLYRGAHWLEAFVLLRRKNQYYGKSDRFFVVIK